MRAAKRRASSSRPDLPSGSGRSGAPMRTSTLPGRSRERPLGRMGRTPWRWTGTTGTEQRFAR
jgi:hypothetical protein